MTPDQSVQEPELKACSHPNSVEHFIFPSHASGISVVILIMDGDIKKRDMRTHKPVYHSGQQQKTFFYLVIQIRYSASIIQGELQNISKGVPHPPDS
jgi:hypothetical protein